MVCNFCNNLTFDKQENITNPWDEILLETENFSVLVSKGSIVEGWLLIVTKNHYLCFGQLSKKMHSEYKSLINRVCGLLNECYGPVVIFEHGPSKPNQAVGCSVDHAHIHIVPTKHNIIIKAEEIFGDKFSWEKVQGISETQKYYLAGLPYLYVQQPSGNAFVTTHPSIPSQLFRKAIASLEDKPDNYNWKEYNYSENIILTIDKIKQKLKEQASNLPVVESV